MHRFWFAAVVLGCALSVGILPRLQADENESPPINGNSFFAGTVIESTSEKVTVERTVLGKTENRSFAVTPETKVEGRLRPRVRVTVRYISDDNGDTATMIIVRAAGPAQPNQQKKK